MEILMIFSTHGKQIKLRDFLTYAYIFINLTFYILISVESVALTSFQCHDVQCVHGVCREGRCICNPGWQGIGCHRCGGRVRLTEPSGFIIDGTGNYSVDMQCTWLIESGLPNSTIRLEVAHFETECSWDHLYIFDGDSVFSRLLAAYSGVLVRYGTPSDKLSEIVATSGSAYIYFYSDAAYNMSGVNITYSINSCPKNCSGRGPCVDGFCTCWASWTGEACDVPVCPSNCQDNGECDVEHHRCICKPGYTGFDCSFRIDEGWWAEEPAKLKIQGRALHEAVVIGDEMWVIGGENFHHASFQNMIRYNFIKRNWKVIASNSTVEPLSRYCHSVVTYEDNLYMYGGMLYNGTVLNELWLFNTTKRTWHLLSKMTMDQNCHSEPCSPLAAMGHTATVVGNYMIVIFGHNPVYGYLNTVQHYNFGSNHWELIVTKGAIVKGGYGHTSVYDSGTQRIYVYGGYHSYGAEAALVDFLYAYNSWEYTWVLLTPSQSHRYLHSSVILNGMMLVFGGNTHNGTSYSNGGQCFSADFQAYDIACDTWHTMNFPSIHNQNIARFGHSAVVYNGSMYVFGGFNGQMLNDIQKLTPGSCEKNANNGACEKAAPGIKCVWNFEKKICQPFSVTSKVASYHTCSRRGANVTSLCGRLTSCPSCLENTYGCVWCGSSCSHGRCGKNIKETNVPEKCEVAESSNCDKLHNCHACHTEYHCGWQTDEKCYTFVRESSNGTEKAILNDDYRVKCEIPCSSRTTCENCTQGPCMWCSSQQICIESNAYAAVFPVAQCMEWTTQMTKCRGLNCRDIQTCDQCQKNPRCGWCDDGSGTGLGVCLEGSAAGPVVMGQSTYLLNNTVCSAGQWFFTTCPACQCNGHSTCVNGTEKCVLPCQHLTEGSHCQQCMASYHGDPVNGGNCTPCFCNNHGDLCHRETGRCYCTTKGINGPHCNRCDESNHYVGNPEEENGSCFYNLSIDFQYTFNMSKPEDRHYTNINFMNIPVKPDVDVDFTISCSDSALVNISVASSSSPEKFLDENHKCGTFKLRFSHDDHVFGADNSTFYVYVFNFNTPFVLQISFSQHRQLDLLQFFITFSSCFLSLLIMAAVMWKIKQKYDLYRRRQRLFVEMEQMASRPFAGVAVELDAQLVIISAHTGSEDRRKKCHPTPIALEPCSGGKAAVLSLIVRLPPGEEEYTPAGQSGLGIASALVSLGTLCKGNTDVIKESCKLDSWKTSSNSSTCI
ncbi:attractin-like protein 1 isoform X2 [Parasteatoda tepidariorum]|nr:attractin-like protein 1 isoform X2 [Parasteatoda tepidariorum]